MSRHDDCDKMNAVSGKLFARPWIFIRGVPAMKFLPPEGPAEIAFAGRSNVGKSSLINALVGKKGLARTSKVPGRTQELNYFVPDGYSGESGNLPPVALVDMPGYGFAKAPKAQVDAWTRLIFEYLRGRVTLKRVYLLVDARQGLKEIDGEVMGLLDAAAVSYQVALTKVDKIKQSALGRLVEETLLRLAKRSAAFPEVLATSSQKDMGTEEMRAAIIRATGRSEYLPGGKSVLHTQTVGSFPPGGGWESGPNADVNHGG